MGKPRNTQKYPTYPEIPEIPGNTRNTRKYPKEKKIPGNTRLYFSTLLPDPNLTRYPVFCQIPDPILKNPTRWALLSVQISVEEFLSPEHRKSFTITARS